MSSRIHVRLGLVLVGCVACLQLVSCGQNSTDAPQTVQQRKLQETIPTQPPNRSGEISLEAKRILALPGNQIEKQLLAWVKSMDDWTYDEIGLAYDSLPHPWNAGNVGPEIVKLLTKKSPEKAFAQFFNTDLISTVTMEWARSSKPEDLIKIFKFITDQKYKSLYLNPAISGFNGDYAQQCPKEFITTIQDYTERGFFDQTMVVVASSLADIHPKETLQLIEKMHDPNRRLKAFSAFGEKLSAVSTEKNQYFGLGFLNDLPSGEAKAAAIGGAYRRMLTRDFEQAITQLHTIQDQGIYDRIIVENIDLLDRKLSADVVLGLVAEVKGPKEQDRLAKSLGKPKAELFGKP